MTLARSTRFYDPSTPVATVARDRDLAWFKANPGAKWRVRPSPEGESALLDGMRALNPATRGYVIAIDHARAKDRRAAVGLGIYPVIVRLPDRERAKAILAAEGERWARWFKKHSTTPPPSLGMATLAEVGL
jgi:hypothetical protein